MSALLTRRDLAGETRRSKSLEHGFLKSYLYILALAGELHESIAKIYA